ncbi:hydantoinase/oxoprolinase family protein [Nocardioides ginsengisoli]|uniref:hydantoinase/oxoprolinase family protein n=1 Tax=Nocardioides ginsengisoli TaxID=363868 RepID=UPI00338A283A
MRIGIDIGGTNTDAVLMDGDRVVASHKSPTTASVGEGVERAIREVLDIAGVDGEVVRRVVLGTTHFTNAVVQRRGLDRVCAIRLGAPASRAFPPFSIWPDDLADATRGSVALLPGGVNFDGSPITALDEAALRTAADRAVADGLTSIALTSVFAPLSSDNETLARDVMAAQQPTLSFSLSSDIGNLGVLERENATILNACLASTAVEVMKSIESALTRVGVDCPFYLSQNDGTLMSADFAARFPVRTFASGPTNSIRGAGFLAGVEDALVVDIGGTTTDVGALRRGFPRESANTTELAGLRTNFRMPDLVSIGVGGGSIVSLDASPIAIGPRSVARELRTRARVFGGDTLTVTDLAVAAGRLSVGTPSLVAALDPELVARATSRIQELVERAVDAMRLAADAVPVVLVGGGAPLVGPDAFAGQTVLRPDHADVANAVGSAIAYAGGESDRIYDLDGLSREEAVQLAEDEARRQCVHAGAEAGTVEIVEVDALPLTYLPGQSVRIRVKAAGPPAA